MAINLSITPSFSARSSYTDEHARELTQEELRHYLPNSNTIPTLCDIPLASVNRVLFEK